MSTRYHQQKRGPTYRVPKKSSNWDYRQESDSLTQDYQKQDWEQEINYTQEEHQEYHDQHNHSQHFKSQENKTSNSNSQRLNINNIQNSQLSSNLMTGSGGGGGSSNHYTVTSQHLQQSSSYHSQQQEQENENFGSNYRPIAHQRQSTRGTTSRRQNPGLKTPYRNRIESGSSSKAGGVGGGSHGSNCGGGGNMTKNFGYQDQDQFFPHWQPLLRCDEAPAKMSAIQRELFSQAEKGELLIEIESFVRVIQNSQEKALQNIKVDDCYDLIDLAEDQGIVHRTKRNFANMKTLCFISLQLDVISSECLKWVLQSLRRDEMSPTERAIQSRIKEAFAFKVSTQQWEGMLECIKYEEEINPYKVTLPASIMEEANYSSQTAKIKTTISSTTVTNPVQSVKYRGGINNSDAERKQYQSVNSLTHSHEHPMFKIREIVEDPAIGQITNAIFLLDEPEWQGIDQNSLQEGFMDQQNALYEALKIFLQKYFCDPSDEDKLPQNTKEEEKWCSSIQNGLTRSSYQTYSTISQKSVYQSHNHQSSSQHQLGTYEIDYEEVRAIPGGRYGCAQFVKICGPPCLKQCSLGRLAQLVQHAVKEDILRYHKTLLVWTTTVDKHKRKADENAINHSPPSTTQTISIKEEVPSKVLTASEAKLQTVKQALVEILTENKQGMSLAQLPLYLRRKLSFSLDLNELGFPKLKDLILSMSNRVKLELRGHNHPFAYLIKQQQPRVVKSNYVLNSSHNISDSIKDENFNACPKENKIKVESQAEFDNQKGLTSFIQAIEDLLNTNISGINQTEIQGLLNSCLSANCKNNKYLGSPTLLDLLQNKILTSSHAQLGDWQLDVTSDTNFILRKNPDLIKTQSLRMPISKLGGSSNFSQSLSQQSLRSPTGSTINVNLKNQPQNTSVDQIQKAQKIGLDSKNQNAHSQLIMVEAMSGRPRSEIQSHQSNESLKSLGLLTQEAVRDSNEDFTPIPQNQAKMGFFSPQFSISNQMGASPKSQDQLTLNQVVEVRSHPPNQEVTFQNSSTSSLTQSHLQSYQKKQAKYPQYRGQFNQESQGQLDLMRGGFEAESINSYQGQIIKKQEPLINKFQNIQRDNSAQFQNQIWGPPQTTTTTTHNSNVSANHSSSLYCMSNLHQQQPFSVINPTNSQKVGEHQSKSVFIPQSQYYQQKLPQFYNQEVQNTGQEYQNAKMNSKSQVWGLPSHQQMTRPSLATQHQSDLQLRQAFDSLTLDQKSNASLSQLSIQATPTSYQQVKTSSYQNSVCGGGGSGGGEIGGEAGGSQQSSIFQISPNQKMRQLSQQQQMQTIDENNGCAEQQNLIKGGTSVMISNMGGKTLFNSPIQQSKEYQQLFYHQQNSSSNNKSPQPFDSLHLQQYQNHQSQEDDEKIMGRASGASLRGEHNVQMIEKLLFQDEDQQFETFASRGNNLSFNNPTSYKQMQQQQQQQQHTIGLTQRVSASQFQVPSNQHLQQAAFPVQRDMRSVQYSGEMIMAQKPQQMIINNQIMANQNNYYPQMISGGISNSGAAFPQMQRIPINQAYMYNHQHQQHQELFRINPMQSQIFPTHYTASAASSSSSPQMQQFPNDNMYPSSRGQAVIYNQNSHNHNQFGYQNQLGPYNNQKSLQFDQKQYQQQQQQHQQQQQNYNLQQQYMLANNKNNQQDSLQ